MFLPVYLRLKLHERLIFELYGRRDMWKEDEEHALMEAIESQEASEDLRGRNLFAPG